MTIETAVFKHQKTKMIMVLEENKKFKQRNKDLRDQLNVKDLKYEELKQKYDKIIEVAKSG